MSNRAGRGAWARTRSTFAAGPVDSASMELIGPAFVVFAILIVVAIAAVSFEPANPFEHWVRLAERYATERRPSEIGFADQRILFGGKRGRLKPLTPFATIDATIDDFGLWFVCKGVEADQFDPALKIPGTHIRAAGEHGKHRVFELYAEPPVRIAVQGALGQELADRARS